MIAHRFALVAALALVAVMSVGGIVAGCGARDGGVCQIASDCASGFFCCKNDTAPATRGVCRANGTPEAMCAMTVPVDAFISDGGPTDAFVSDASDLDASTEDAATEDAATEDAGPTDDAATDDAGATDDAAADDAGP